MVGDDLKAQKLEIALNSTNIERELIKTQKERQSIMAEQNLNQNMGGTEPTTEPDTNTQQEPDTGAPTVAELMAQLAEARAAETKAKADRDKALKGKAESDKQLRARMTAEEKETQAREEAEAQKAEAEREKDRRIAMYEARDRYRALGLPDELVESAAEADVENDKDALTKIFSQHMEQKLKERDAEWMKKTPQPNAGGQYSSMTREQIMAITDPDKRKEAIAANLDIFS